MSVSTEKWQYVPTKSRKVNHSDEGDRHKSGKPLVDPLRGSHAIERESYYCWVSLLYCWVSLYTCVS